MVVRMRRGDKESSIGDGRIAVRLTEDSASLNGSSGISLSDGSDTMDGVTLTHEVERIT